MERKYNTRYAVRTTEGRTTEGRSPTLNQKRDSYRFFRAVLMSLAKLLGVSVPVLYNVFLMYVKYILKPSAEKVLTVLKEESMSTVAEIYRESKEQTANILVDMGRYIKREATGEIMYCGANLLMVSKTTRVDTELLGFLEKMGKISIDEAVKQALTHTDGVFRIAVESVFESLPMKLPEIEKKELNQLAIGYIESEREHLDLETEKLSLYGIPEGDIQLFNPIEDPKTVAKSGSSIVRKNIYCKGILMAPTWSRLESSVAECRDQLRDRSFVENLQHHCPRVYNEMEDTIRLRTKLLVQKSIDLVDNTFQKTSKQYKYVTHDAYSVIIYFVIFAILSIMYKTLFKSIFKNCCKNSVDRRRIEEFKFSGSPRRKHMSPKREQRNRSK